MPANYRQFANVLLPPSTEKFTFTSAPSASEEFYFVAFNRARMREKIDPGNWELRLGSHKFIDDSGAQQIIQQSMRVVEYLTLLVVH